jgi:hypothetical protein
MQLQVEGIMPRSAYLQSAFFLTDFGRRGAFCVRRNFGNLWLLSLPSIFAAIVLPRY